MGWLYFFHILGVALWLGSMASVYVLHQKEARIASTADHTLAYQTTRSIVRGIVTPSALLVLLSGITMITIGFSRQSLPFYMVFMEQFGGMLALLSAGILTWQMRGIDRAVDAAQRRNGLRRLNRTMATIALGVVIVIFVVGLRL